MKRLTFIKMINVLTSLSMKNIVVNTAIDASKVYREVMQIALTKYGPSFKQELEDLGLVSGLRFKDWINNANTRDALAQDPVGSKLTPRIKFAKSSDIEKEIKNIYNKYEKYIVTNEDEILSADSTFAVRTNDGQGPVVFITGMPDFGYEARHEVRRWYAWQYKIDYFAVRECSYEFWNNNPDVQYATIK